MDKPKNTKVTISSSLHARLARQAERRGQSVAELTEHVLGHWLGEVDRAAFAVGQRVRLLTDFGDDWAGYIDAGSEGRIVTIQENVLIYQADSEPCARLPYQEQGITWELV